LRLLIDSNVLIWAVAQPTELSTTARRLLQDAGERFVSIASIWEIAIKISVGKLSLPREVTAALDLVAAEPLAITTQHIRRVQSLPFHHRDPFDRMMVAQAMEEGLTIVTRDRHIKLYGVPVLAA
jgi:PIN domain nuclease of toxin-antitoxin system